MSSQIAGNFSGAVWCDTDDCITYATLVCTRIGPLCHSARTFPSNSTLKSISVCIKPARVVDTCGWRIVVYRGMFPLRRIFFSRALSLLTYRSTLSSTQIPPDTSSNVRTSLS